jgi:hypothetical protein
LLRKTPFLAKYRQKSMKLVIITLTPENGS